MIRIPYKSPFRLLVLQHIMLQRPLQQCAFALESCLHSLRLQLQITFAKHLVKSLYQRTSIEHKKLLVPHIGLF